MMGRLNHEQEQFFYSFRLDEAVSDDHPVLYCFALDLRNGDRSEWAKVVDPAGDQVLHRRATARR